MKRVIADSGSTKTSWVLLDGPSELCRVRTAGINPVFSSREDIVALLREKLLPALPQGVAGDVAEVDFYAAGIVSDESRTFLSDTLRELFPSALCRSESDMLAAARALFGGGEGIACILGTGSNSCLYDGRSIVKNVRAGGFILGDEGSGASLGKALVADFIKGLLPTEIASDFAGRYGLDYPAIVQKVYKEPYPGRFLASFSPFISEYIGHPHIRAIVEGAFSAFFRRNVASYGRAGLPVGFVGSVASHYEDILRQVALKEGFECGPILQEPLDGLIKYHTAL